jgi:hypothetical protein
MSVLVKDLEMFVWYLGCLLLMLVGQLIINALIPVTAINFIIYALGNFSLLIQLWTGLKE